MKEMNMKKFLSIIAGLSILCGFFSCKEQDAVYKEYLVLNGRKYPQRPDSLRILSGYNKLRLKWLKAKDPSVVLAKVYWNNYTDSVEVDLRNAPDTIVVDIVNLQEATYTFHVVTFDGTGNKSMPTEISGTSYGDNFLIGATDRTYVSAIRDDDMNGTVEWGTRTADLAYTEVRYKTGTGSVKVVKVLPSEKFLTCPDIKPGELFEYRSVFLPPKGIDFIPREWQTSSKPFMYFYPRETWTAEAKNGNHSWGDGGGGFPVQVFDGRDNTGWHSKVGTPFPQVFVADMKESLEIDNITIVPPTQLNWRYLDELTLYVSDTKLSASDPDGSWPEHVLKTKYDGSDRFNIQFPAGVKGRYLAIVFDTGTKPYISFMELEVYGY